MNSPLEPNGKCTVLVVDDTPDNLSLMSGLLRADYKVKLAPSGERALQIVAGESKPDLILLDMNFQLDTTSGEEGLRFLRYLQQQGYDIPVVAMTAWSNTTLVVQAMQAGAGDFVEKPWNNQRLQQILQQQLKLQ